MIGIEAVKQSDREYSLGKLTRYFLWLGFTGFGGPIVLSEHMQDELVTKRGWITKDEYSEGLALAQLAPGPLAAQLAIYLGWVRSGVLGATVIGVAFILPSFLIVLTLAEAYRRFQSLPWIQGAFYGIGATVIAIISQSAFKLVRKSIGRDRFLLTLAIINAGLTIILQKELLWFFLASGVLAILVMAPFSLGLRARGLIPSWLLLGIQGSAPASILGKLFVFFAKAGAVVFGSGLAIVPFLHGGVVHDNQWLNERQFLDAVAVAMITPGPVVITVAFIGYLVAGMFGAVSAGLGVFLPVYLFVVMLAPFFKRLVANAQIRAFVNGVTAAAIGSIAGAAVILGRRAIYDLPTIAICVASLYVVFRVKRVPEPILILLAAAIGLILKH